jgi:polyhydroxybutyrate depolymerase
MDGLARLPGQGGVFQTADPAPTNRDLRFFDTALADLRTRFRIDDARIFATGFSNGAKFVYLLWATRPQIFAAFAPVAGMLAPGLRLTEPKPVIHIAGREDHQNEFRLQIESIELARQADRTGPGKSCGDTCTIYSGASGQNVMTVLHSGGHVYPSDATRRIVAFLKEQKRRLPS